ncbi:MAG: protein-glutamate O-methyltransferase CheR [Oscillospiraceae bacterium]|nr:protein-glutamate O-methyltransferase CheR [Oscillospiraceae bacterium]MBQ8979255.1 protein-glutamate O-methyltransferase CheR [Oscillospiraceae bacterium]
MFDKLTYRIRADYGINLDTKQTLVEGRLSQPALARGFRDINDYLAFVFEDETGQEMLNVVNRITTNHTFFMREAEHFRFLSSVIMPYIENTVLDKDVRIWCAGCSTGQEAYSLAITINDYFGHRKGGWDTVILATDINSDALQTAREAVYPQDALQGLTQDQIDRYFIRLSNGDYRVCDYLRSEVNFKRFNLMEPIVYKKPFDLISCRNVTIYFDTATKDALFDRFYECTKPGGYLFTGHAENVSRNSPYEYIQPATYRKTGHMI